MLFSSGIRDKEVRSITTLKDIESKIQKTIGLDMAVVLVLATLLVIFALTLSEGNPLRIVFGLPFLLFLPGYSLVSVLWTKKSELEGLERVALSLGLSIAILPLVGLVLNYTPWGITLASILAALYGVIVVLVALAWFRRQKVRPEERFSLDTKFLFDTAESMSQADKIVVIIIAFAIVIGGALLFYIASNPPRERFTELYILDDQGTTDDYPTTLAVDEIASITIVVVSHEQYDTDYTLMVKLHSDDGSNQTLDQFNFSISDDETWSQDYDFAINQSGQFRLELELIKGDDTIPYASNHLWIEVEN